MLTFFACPKPFIGKDDLIQCNAIESWLRLGNVVLMGKDEGVAEVAEELGCQYEPDIMYNSHGTPIVSSIFSRAMEVAETDILCYVNSDIILMSDFLEALEIVAGRFPKFLIVGQRWDIDISWEVRFVEDWEEGLREYVQEHGRLHAPSGIDWFCWRGQVWDYIPPFALGRTVWDMALLWAALYNRVPVVDATADIMTIHQNHGWSHIDGGYNEAWHGEESKANTGLAAGTAHIDHSNFILQNGELRVRR